MSQILTFENPLGSPYSPMNDLPGARAPEEARAPRSGAAARCPRVGQAHRRRAVCAGGRLHLVRPASRMGQSKAQPKPKRAAERKKTGRSGSAVTLLRQTVSVFAAFLAYLCCTHPSAHNGAHDGGRFETPSSVSHRTMQYRIAPSKPA